MKSPLPKTKQSPALLCHAGPLTKRLLALSAFLALLPLGAGVASAGNVLFNGTLDQIGFTSQINPCPIGWVVDASKTISGAFFDGGDSETFCNVIDTGGYGFFFKPFQGTVGPPADLLTVKLYQDNPSTPGTKYTLSGYAAGEANYSGFFTTNSPAPKTLFVIEFLNAANSVIASNGFDLVAAGLPNTGPGSMASFLYTTPEVTAPAGTVAVRAGATMANTYGTSGAQSFFVDGFDLEATAPPGAPVITNEPVQTSVSLGANASFTVGVSNTAGVSYQWQLYNTNLSNSGEFSGVNTKTITITGVSASDVGHYRVLVSNTAGSVYSDDATLAIVGVNFYPVVSITGKIGDTYRVDYSTKVAPTTWIPLSTNKLVSSPQLVIDTSSPGNNSRFYRAVFLY
jgi:hypothetical protein